MEIMHPRRIEQAPVTSQSGTDLPGQGAEAIRRSAEAAGAAYRTAIRSALADHNSEEFIASSRQETGE